MDDLTLIKELAKQLPYVAAVIFVVLKFLAYIREGDRSRQEWEEKKSVYVTGQITDALNNNTMALGRNTEILDRLESRLSAAKQGAA